MAKDGSYLGDKKPGVGRATRKYTSARVCGVIRATPSVLVLSVQLSQCAAARHLSVGIKKHTIIFHITVHALNTEETQQGLDCKCLFSSAHIRDVGPILCVCVRVRVCVYTFKHACTNKRPILLWEQSVAMRVPDKKRDCTLQKISTLARNSVYC